MYDYGRMLRVDSGGDEEGSYLADLITQLFRVLKDCDCVQINNAEDTLVIVLDLDPVL